MKIPSQTYVSVQMGIWKELQGRNIGGGSPPNSRNEEVSTYCSEATPAASPELAIVNPQHQPVCDLPCLEALSLLSGPTASGRGGAPWGMLPMALDLLMSKNWTLPPACPLDFFPLMTNSTSTHYGFLQVLPLPQDPYLALL